MIRIQSAVMSVERKLFPIERAVALVRLWLGTNPPPIFATTSQLSAPARLRLRTETPKHGTHHTSSTNSPTQARLCSRLSMSASVSACSNHEAGRYLYIISLICLQHVSIRTPTPLSTSLYQEQDSRNIDSAQWLLHYTHIWRRV